jgi:CRISPR-associated protein Csm4
MKILKIKPVSGLLSDLQSDTIYGHFCWRLKDRLGEDKLKDFINLYRNNNPIFLLSDGLLSYKEDILFPKPLVFYEFEIPQKKTDKIIDFVKRKSEKESKFISLSQLNSFLSSGSFSTEITEPQIENKSTKILEEHLRVSVQIDRNNFTSADGKLFSYNPKYLSDDYYYSVLIKILDDNLFKEFDCENVLKDVFEIGFGKKKSSGFGQFQFVSFEEFNGIKEPEKSDSFIVLGNYLPASDDKVEPIGYDIILSMENLARINLNLLIHLKIPWYF